MRTQRKTPTVAKCSSYTNLIYISRKVFMLITYSYILLPAIYFNNSCGHQFNFKIKYFYGIFDCTAATTLFFFIANFCFVLFFSLSLFCFGLSSFSILENYAFNVEQKKNKSLSSSSCCYLLNVSVELVLSYYNLAVCLTFLFQTSQ